SGPGWDGNFTILLTSRAFASRSRSCSSVLVSSSLSKRPTADLKLLDLRQHALGLTCVEPIMSRCCTPLAGVITMRLGADGLNCGGRGIHLEQQCDDKDGCGVGSRTWRLGGGGGSFAARLRCATARPQPRSVGRTAPPWRC